MKGMTKNLRDRRRRRRRKRRRKRGRRRKRRRRRRRRKRRWTSPGDALRLAGWNCCSRRFCLDANSHTDGRTDGRTDRRKDGWTYGGTDIPSYRYARTYPKRLAIEMGQEWWEWKGMRNGKWRQNGKNSQNHVYLKMTRRRRSSGLLGQINLCKCCQGSHLQ